MLATLKTLDLCPIADQCPPMTLSRQLRESRLKHTLKNYDDAVKQLRVFKAVLPITSKKSDSSATMRLNEDSATYQVRSRN